MTDMTGIAGNAVSVYQQALTTVSNNIANVSTEGYSRQDVSLSALPVTKYGAAFLGSGVGLDRIKRQYDAFVESNLRNTTSDLEAQGPMVNYANRVVDVLGSSTMGLNTAFDAFFASARNLSGDPASTVLRSGFVRDSQGVADRFGQLSSQLDLVQQQTQQDLESSVTQINTLTDQIAKVNIQLAKQKMEASQPPDLLDQRDLLLKQLSVFARINTRFEASGIVKVSAGPTINADVLVDNQKSFMIEANFDSASTEKVALVLDPYGKASALSRITSGSLSGILAFRAQVLGGSRTALDGLAQTFANEVNKIHQEGVDGYGNAGQALFTFDPKAINPAGGMQVTFDDPLMVAAGAQFRVVEGAENPSGTNAKVVYDLSPAATTGNKDAVAVAGPPALQTVLLNNASVGIAKQINVSSSVGVTSVAAVNMGMQDVSVYLDNMQPGQQLQIYTRDGRHILGSTDISALAEDNLVNQENGFAQGATLSNDYLNKSGISISVDGTQQVLGYKGMNVFYGAQANVPAEPILDSKDAVTGYNYLPAVLSGNRIASLTKNTMPPPPNGFFPEGSFTLNGYALGDLNPPSNGTALQSSAIAHWINQSTELTGVTAKASNVIVIKPQDIRYGMPLYIQGQAVQTKNNDSPAALAKAINQANAGVEAVINSTGELIITNNVKSNDISLNISQLPLNNGNIGLPLFIKDGGSWKQIQTGSVSTPEELIREINNAGAGVQARLSGFDLIISRTAARAGEEISISTEGATYYSAETGIETSLRSQVDASLPALGTPSVFTAATSENASTNSVTLSSALASAASGVGKSISIMGVTISGTPTAYTAATLATAIAAKSSLLAASTYGLANKITGVTANAAGKLTFTYGEKTSAVTQGSAPTVLGIPPRTFKVANAGDDISVSATLSDNPGITSITALGISSTTFHGKVELVKPAVDAVIVNTSKIDLGTVTNADGTKKNTKGLMVNGQAIDLGSIRIPALPTPPAASATAQVKSDYNQALIAAMPAYRTAILAIAKAINDKADTTNVTARLSEDSRNLILGSIANDTNPKIRITGNFATDDKGVPVSKKDPLASVLQSGSNLGQDSVKNAADQYTYQDDALGIGNGSWPAEPINTVIIKKDQVSFDKPLYIKDAGVWKKVTMYSVATLEDMAANISNSGAGVKATVNAQGDLVISNDDKHLGQDIRTSAVASDATGTSLVTALGQIATTFRVKHDFKPSGPIQLGFGAGSPNQLAQLGFRTGAFVSGEVKDDLLFFVTGPGNAAVSATYSGQPADAKQNLRTQSLNVKFFQDPAKHNGALYYTISSTDTTKPALGATVVAERVFNPEMLNPGVSFQGLNISFTGVPKANDIFKMDGNKDGLGNNDNLLSISELETKAVVGSKTLTNSYIDQVNEMGNIARQAAISQTALKVVNEQAIQSRDEISGVSLDKEAADLIRYQQAYQASAKVLQIASQLFEAVLRV